MKSLSTSWTDRVRHPFLTFVIALAVILVAFLFAVGLGPDRLPFPPQSGFSDAATSHWPAALFLRQSVLDDHTWPLWRPLIMSGQPFAANPLNKVWYPPQWLVFVFPPALHLNILIGLHLIAGGAGAWTWGRATGLTFWPATLVGIGFAFAPRLIAALGAGHLDLIYAAAWIPWLLWAAHRLTRLVPDRRAAAWLALFAALCFLADVRLSAYAFALTAAYLVWQWAAMPPLRNRRAAGRIGAYAGIAALFAAGLTAMQWVPLIMMRSQLSRSTITLDEAAVHSLEWGQWIGLLIGDHGGSWETLVYVGISTLALALVGLLLRPRMLGFWGLVILFVGVYAMGDQFIIWPAANRLIPALRWWRVPPRVWLIAALILPYLAGWGAQLLVERPSTRRAARLAVVGLLGGGVVCSAFSLVMLAPSLQRTAAAGLIAFPAVALVMTFAIFGRLPPRVLLILFTLVVAADVMWIDRTLVEGRPRRDWLDPYRDLAGFLRDDGAIRVYSPGYSLPQQAAAYWQIQQFGGVDPFQLAAYVQAAEAATGVRTAGYSITVPPYDVSQESDLATANRHALLNPDVLGQWLVTHVIAAFEIDADGLILQARLGDNYIYRNTQVPEVTLAWDGPNRAIITAAGPYQGTLYAVANGRWKERERASPGLPGDVEPPVQSWTFNYDPSEVWVSLLVGGLAIALAACGWWVARRV